eukprot:4266427-Prymnesium_polylepis.1
MCAGRACTAQAADRSLNWGDKSYPILGADGRLFDEAIFRGEAFFDRNLFEEELAFTVYLAKRVLFLLASSAREKRLWVQGINTLLHDRDAYQPPRLRTRSLSWTRRSRGGW